MASYDTTATCQDDAYMDEVNPATNVSAVDLELSDAANGVSSRRPIISFVLPPKPIGADRINKTFLVLTVASSIGPANIAQQVYKIKSALWTEGGVTWNNYAAGTPWGTAGGDLEQLVAVATNLGAQFASFTFDIGAYNLDWGERGSVILKLTTDTPASQVGWGFYSTESVATVAMMPHIVVRYDDDPPDAIRGATVSPDISLSEASYTFRQRAILSWGESDASDFSRYRIRKGINRSQSADHTHLTFVNSRGSTTYLDPTLYTDSSTIYYSIYVEDQENQSASTNANVSNVVSWTKPDAVVGSVSIGSSASTLQEIEVRARTTTMGNAKKAKVIWGDGGYSFTQNLTSAGGYIYARHRYTKATAGYTIRAQIEDVNGFRSAPDSYGTSVTISNLGPIAKIVASPSRQMTASTFSFGVGPTSGGPWAANSLVLNLNSCPSDGVVTRIRTRASSTGDMYAMLWREEGSFYRCIYADKFSLSTANTNIGRDVNWGVRRGDVVGFQNPGSGAGICSIPIPHQRYVSTSTVISPGSVIAKYRLAGDNNNTPSIRASIAYTNPIHFSAKDSFARGSNKFINRFRWDTDYNGTFGSDFDTGATTSYYQAWTTATTQFIAVRAVDNSHASSIDIAGVVIETEATFRIPDSLHDKLVEHMTDSRSRGYTQSPILMRDYGSLDLSNLDPRTLQIRGKAVTTNSTTLNYLDIEYLSAAFQQKKRIYVIPPSSATAAQGYIVESPVTHDVTSPVEKGWSLTVAVST